MKGLIIGMGIGGLYQSVLTTLGYDVVTVDADPEKGADFVDVDSAIMEHGNFDTVHVCTPNFTHKDLTQRVAPISKIVFVEKPGFASAKEWLSVINAYPDTRIMMVKNNQWRDNIEEMRTLARRSHIVNINWIRKNCVPCPGSWFTNRELAYGGVSRDLMPHLLSLYIAINPQWQTTSLVKHVCKQQWQLSDIDTTDYGTVNTQGVYDVDDYARIEYGSKWILQANWRDLDVEEMGVKSYTRRSSCVYQSRIDLGWCPESAYLNMVKHAVDNVNNTKFWNEQLLQDTWIHEQVELLCK